VVHREVAEAAMGLHLMAGAGGVVVVVVVEVVVMVMDRRHIHLEAGKRILSYSCFRPLINTLVTVAVTADVAAVDMHLTNSATTSQCSPIPKSRWHFANIPVNDDSTFRPTVYYFLLEN
jgi:hypothetical protein